MCLSICHIKRPAWTSLRPKAAKKNGTLINAIYTYPLLQLEFRVSNFGSSSNVVTVGVNLRTKPLCLTSKNKQLYCYKKIFIVTIFGTLCRE